MEQTIDPAGYVELVAPLLGLDLDPEYLPGVVKNFATISAIASLVTEFPLPDEVESATIFEP